MPSDFPYDSFRTLWNLSETFPSNSTHTRFSSGQNRVTERKLTLSNPESIDAFRKTEKERITMSNNNNQLNIPQAREAMDKFKMQAASEVGVNLTNGYNGHLTSREAGSVGGQMVKNQKPEITKFYTRKNRIKEGHSVEIRYIIRLVV